MLNFPDAPAADQTFDATPIKRFTWKGDRWRRILGAAPPLLPTLTALIPDTTPADNATLAIQVQGSNFTAASVVRFDGVAVPTTYVSATSLNATAPASSVAAAASVTVVDGAAVSNDLPFTYTAVSAPLPVLSALNPASAAQNTGPHTVAFIGTGFTPESKAVLNGVDAIQTTYVSPTEIRADYVTTAGLSPDMATVVWDCWVRTGAQVSNSLPFAMYHPSIAVPDIATVNPDSTPLWSTASERITVSGSGGTPKYSSDAICYMNGIALPTTYQGVNTLHFDIVGIEWTDGVNPTSGDLQVRQANGVSNVWTFLFSQT